MRHHPAHHLTALALFAAFCALLPATAFASPLEIVLCDVVDLISSDLGRGICTLAVASVGVGAMLGKVSWTMGITIAVGLGITFTASTVTSYMLDATVPC